jgi:aryl-alcohol dehydrogenase-like predicted oxidoreductase
MSSPRQLGSHGPRVFPIGLGCMGMSDLYGPADESDRIATIHAALDAGVTVLDTGDYWLQDTTSCSSTERCATDTTKRCWIALRRWRLRKV